MLSVLLQLFPQLEDTMVKQLKDAQSRYEEMKQTDEKSKDEVRDRYMNTKVDEEGAARIEVHKTPFLEFRVLRDWKKISSYCIMLFSRALNFAILAKWKF